MKLRALFTEHPERSAIFVLILTHLIAAIFSTGFHHPDEHCQVLEFANFASGLIQDPSLLRWEYAAKIRPWFQPDLHAILMKAGIVLGIYEAHAFATFFRLLYALLNLLALLSLWRAVRDRDGLDPRWLLWISVIWFFPYLHVRTSSENLSGIFLTFAAARMVSKRSALPTGLLLGAAFLARYQVALGLVTLAPALLFRDRGIRKTHLQLLFGFLLMTGIGCVLDRIGYGVWTLTPWNYFRVNLIEGVAATYSPHPWYQYLVWILMLNPFWSLPLFFGTLRYARLGKKDGLSALVLGFVLFHFFMTNKDIRFLFPVLNLAAVLSASAFSGLERTLFRKALLVPQLLSSLLGFSYTALQLASAPEFWALFTIEKLSVPGETWITNGADLNPMRQTYYPLPPIRIRECRDQPSFGRCLDEEKSPKVLLMFHRNDPVSEGFLSLLDRKGCERIRTSQPDFLFRFEKQFPALKRVKYRAVYRCP
jgi:phosphatidylinositol glycan class B